MHIEDKVIILDFGSQYTQLIARRIREAGVYSEIHPCTIDIDELKSLSPKAIILSGGPASVCELDAPKIDSEVFEWGLPILGICYGMQLIAQMFKGEVTPAKDREYGRSELEILSDSPLWEGLEVKDKLTVWMSHGDTVLSPPPGFEILAKTESIDVAAIGNAQKNIYALQFHPEVAHTEQGDRIINNFLFKIAGLKPTWSMSSFIDSTIKSLREQIGDDHVVCALSGGIDSTVVAVLLNKAIGKRLHCIFVDNGVLRLNEGEEVVSYLREHFDLNLKYV